ncbi:type VI secretion system protein TssA [Polaromonas sp.]|uniref:type VI secretion system protein TssA n=1 Tax=Polaromonas sp. TaxID=1869339 RepID=UPI003265FD93
MNTELMIRSQRYFGERLGCSLENLLDPIDAGNPAGYSVKGNGVYNTIQNARREDDASLPLGPWEHKLKRADWPVVSRIATEALCSKSKDLQVAAWLLEAEVNQHGFSAIAPGLLLLDGLLRDYWDDLYPQDADSGGEHRANILRSLNNRLPFVLKQLAMTSTGMHRNYNLADWEVAMHRERLAPAAAAAANQADEEEHANMETITAAIAATPLAWYQALHQQLHDALAAMQSLRDCIDRHFAVDGPSLSALAGLLTQLHALAESELQRRGIKLATVSGESKPGPGTVAGSDETTIVGDQTWAIDDRRQIYAMLEQLVEALLKMDPHSPAPYLIRRAIEWGRLNTAELYQEVFIRLGGQLNIFELVGLETPAAREET